MFNRAWKRTTFIILFLLLFASCNPNGSQPGSGSTATVNFVSGNFINGDWSLQIKNNGTFSYTGPGVKIKGTYILNEDEMELTTKACGKDKGLYLAYSDGSILTLKAIDDPCTDRVSVLTSAMWYVSP